MVMFLAMQAAGQAGEFSLLYLDAEDLVRNRQLFAGRLTGRRCLGGIVLQQ